MASQMSSVEFLCNKFCEAFSSVFEQTAGEPYPLKSSDRTDGDAGVETLGYVLEFSGKVCGTVVVQVDMDSAARLATKLMGGPLDTSIEYLPEHEDALFEIVSQTAGGIATELRTLFGTADITVERTQEAPTAPSVKLTLTPADGSDGVFVRLLANHVLFDSLASAMSGSGQAAPQETNSSAPAQETSAENQNLRLIMDVELALTLRFGQRTLMLSEVADLTTGSVVELDRVVDDPVELLLGDRVIGRGEVVIVDGNYGLRLTELSSIDQSYFMTA